MRQTPATMEEDVPSHSPNSVLDQTESDQPKKLLVLMSSRCLDPQQGQNQKDAIALLRQRKVHFETVDGMNPLQRNRYVSKLSFVLGLGALILTTCVVFEQEGGVVSH
jgi:hypothetical protein